MDKHTQMSTFSSRVVPVFTSNSSGARYAIVLCSAAISCCDRACERFSIGIRAFMQLPRSIRIGVPSSAIMTFLFILCDHSLHLEDTRGDSPWL